MLISDLTPEEASYLAAVTDPCNDTKNDGIDPARGRIPDGNGRYSFVVKRTSHFQFQPGGGGTLVKGLIKVCCPNTTHNDAAVIVGSITGAPAPTANHTAGTTPWDQPILTSANAGSYYRVVGCAIKINPVSSEQDTAGSFRGGNVTGVAINNLTEYASSIQQMEPGSLQVKDGITVRMRSRSEYSSGSTGSSNWYFLEAKATTADNYGLPTVMFDTLGPNTKLDVYICMIVEFSGWRGLTFTPMTVSPYSSRMMLLDYISGNPEIHPVVSKGHSFQTFLKQAGAVWKMITPVVDLGVRAAVASVPGGSEILTGVQLAKAAVEAVVKRKAKNKKKKAALRLKKRTRVRVRKV